MSLPTAESRPAAERPPLGEPVEPSGHRWTVRERIRIAVRLLLPLWLVIGFGVVHGSLSSGEPETKPSISVGDCFMSPAPGSDRVKSVSCHSTHASTRATAVVDGVSGFAGIGDQACPDDTDTFLSGTQLGDSGRTVCGVDVKGPHAGAPGAGGGVLRAGDCVMPPGALLPRLEEQPCGRADQLTVLGRVEATAGCPTATTDTLMLTDAGVPRPKVCVAPAAGTQ